MMPDFGVMLLVGLVLIGVGFLLLYVGNGMKSGPEKTMVNTMSGASFIGGILLIGIPAMVIGLIAMGFLVAVAGAFKS